MNWIAVVVQSHTRRTVGGIPQHIAISAGGRGFGYQQVKPNTVSQLVRHRCDVSAELCCPDAKPRRWIPLLVTRFGVIKRIDS